MKVIIVGGDWDTKDGRKSHLINSLNFSLEEEFIDIEILNGGNIDILRSMKFNHDAVIWMPNISNDEDKILPNIKKENPELLLVQSKCKRDYSDFEMIKRLLNSHSCLGIIVSPEKQFSVIDPLGNMWQDETDIQTAIDMVLDRLYLLSKMTRKRSNNILLEQKLVIDPDFLEIVKATGEEFSKRVQAVNPDRFLGNASTRCSHGFPSARIEDCIAVSKRNVNKTIIDSDQFVATTLINDIVCYAGKNKPSVDTPIQLELYKEYPNVKYMIHGHCYIKGAPYTKNNIPCGYTEEVQEIIDVYPDKTLSNFAVNLLGHGCLILSDNLEYLTDHTFISREVYESRTPS